MFEMPASFVTGRDPHRSRLGASTGRDPHCSRLGAVSQSNHVVIDYIFCDACFIWIQACFELGQILTRENDV